MKRRSGLLLLLLALLSACGPKRSTVHPNPASQETLRPPSAIGFDFMWRQRVIAEWPTGKQEFEAVLQKQKGELTMLGLSPMGLPGFVLTLHEDTSISIENRMGRDLPFEPVYVLADVQRVFFPWLAADGAPHDGEREGSVGDQQVRELFRAGQLTTREFRRSDRPGQSVRVEYTPTAPGTDAAPSVRLDNGFYRYGLVIETFEQQRL
jgi:hypothetical protein